MWEGGGTVSFMSHTSRYFLVSTSSKWWYFFCRSCATQPQSAYAHMQDAHPSPAHLELLGFLAVVLGQLLVFLLELLVFGPEVRLVGTRHAGRAARASLSRHSRLEISAGTGRAEHEVGRELVHDGGTFALDSASLSWPMRFW
jgi:hypothetical protein